MLVLTFNNKIFTVVSTCRPLFTDMLWRIFREMDTDDIFSLSWGFWSGRFQTPQSVSQYYTACILDYSQCSMFRIIASIRCTKFVKMITKCIFGFMNVILLYSYRRWSLCNECCIHETKVRLLVFL